MRYLKYFKESKKDKPNFQKLNIDGFLVYRGRDAESNEYVTFELSEESDLWFHARGVPGSHLIIKNGGEEVSEDVIGEAAKLVAQYSKAKTDEVLVVYCEKRFVTKKEGDPIGKVQVDESGAKEITVLKK